MSAAVSKEFSLGRDAYDYELPEELVAQQPLPRRGDSRMLRLDGGTGQLTDLHFDDIKTLLEPGDVLVFNDTKVIPARLYGSKLSGGRVEFLLERLLDSHTALVLAGSNKPLRVGHVIRIGRGGKGVSVHVLEREGDLFKVNFEGSPVASVLDRFGRIPLPPYIQRPDQDLDRQRYQTVYASKPGAVAAPTAGLHFDRNLIQELRESGVRCVFLTLHVGAGTFQPVRDQNILTHRMHPEFASIPEEVCRQIKQAKQRGSKVVAVGTTCVRALETLARTGQIEPFEDDTELFLYPGQKFHLVDAMITNFHLPQSTLLMLVCAFAGIEHTMNAYRHAVDNKYRFYSYGDAMFVTPHPSARLC